MTTELMSFDAFKLFISLLTGVVAGLWGVIDLIRFVRLRRADKDDPIVGDKRFGYAIGVMIGVIGVYGVLRYNGVM